MSIKEHLDKKKKKYRYKLQFHILLTKRINIITIIKKSKLKIIIINYLIN